jgi:hypothetical protein
VDKSEFEHWVERDRGQRGLARVRGDGGSPNEEDVGADYL